MKISKVKLVSTEPKPPLSRTFRYIPRDGSPNRLLERYSPRKALVLVTKEHSEMADWIRAQPWDHGRPTSDQFRYIRVSRRLKKCRNLLREFVDELDAITTTSEEQSYADATAIPFSAADQVVRMPSELTDEELAEEAQREARLLDLIRKM